jgi:acyl-CoA synthetase (AMP-forming)/AMP-acid ligase II
MNLASLLYLPSLLVPDHSATIDHHTVNGEHRSRSFAELWGESAVIASHLRAAGYAPSTRVGIMATNCSRLISVMFGATAAGMVAVPLNFRASAEELAHLIEDSSPAVVFAESRYINMIRTVTGPDVAIHVIDLPDADFVAALGSPEPDEEIHESEPGDLAVLLYTSGTSSKPKGVCITHGSLTRYAMEANDAPDGSNTDIMLVSAPLSHVAALTSVTNSLYAGRCLALIPQFEIERWIDAVEVCGVTHSFLVPTMLHRLIDADRITSADLSSLRVLTYGAAPMPPSVIRRAIEVLPSSIDFVGAYGQTETTSTVAILEPADHRMNGTAEENATKWDRLGSVGRVLDDVELRIIDEDGSTLGPNEVGEVLLRTYRSMAGYWGSAGGTRITVDEQGWVHTGDLGRLDLGGYLFLHGRRGDMIIRGGENVIPEEVEDALLRAPGVVEAGVVGIADEDLGEQILAVVVLRSRTALDEVTAYIRDHLPAHKRPARYHVVEELPRTATGKLLRRDLVALVDS